MLKIKEFNSKLIFQIIEYLRNNTTIIIHRPRSGKFLHTDLLIQRDKLLMELLNTQLQIEDLEKVSDSIWK